MGICQLLRILAFPVDSLPGPGYNRAMKTPFPDFDLRLDYTQPPVPPHSPEDADWAATLD
jgi:hypothetical protein